MFPMALLIRLPTSEPRISSQEQEAMKELQQPLSFSSVDEAVTTALAIVYFKAF